MEVKETLSSLDEAYREASIILWNYLHENQDCKVRCTKDDTFMIWAKGTRGLSYRGSWTTWVQRVDDKKYVENALRSNQIVSMTSSQGDCLWKLEDNAITDPETLLQINGRCYTLKQVCEIFESFDKSFEIYKKNKGRY